MSASTVILAITATTTSLIAGLFYAYSCSVNAGLSGLSDSAYVAAMQSINKAIINPLFFLSFMGTLLLLPLSTYLHYEDQKSARFLLLLGATTLYCIGSFGVTMFGNVPLNDALATFNLESASSAEITLQRAKFEGPWNRLHTIRTIASILSLVMVIIACLSETAVFEKEIAK